MSPSEAPAAAWVLTRAISPRDHVRVASTDASGVILNQYARLANTSGDRPTAPWAVPLADNDGFRLLAFDFDAKHSPADAARDADWVSALLARHGIDHLVCQSGPSGGRHVWAALTTPTAPTLIATLARLVAANCPSLDTAPLCNPATGCVRPPGAPHRNGSASIVITGTTDTLRTPTTRPEQLHQLVQELAATINATGSDPRGRDTNLSNDPAGHPYLPGPKRPLPPASAAALNQHPGTGDASTVLWKVLVGAAANHWHLADVAALVPAAPGLEHLRSRRTDSNHRAARSTHDRAQTLRRQWGYAVAFAANNPRSAGADASFDTRAGTITDLLRALQTRADASPGRWNQGGGAADRRVLDTLHSFALTAVTTTVEADIRRIALTCGIGRETARVALTRLAADGWIRKARDSAGVHGAAWTIHPQPEIHREPTTARSQAATRPEGAGAAERTLLLNDLTTRLELLNHDTFSTAHALPHAAGNTYAHLSPTIASTITDPTELDLLSRLEQHGLATASLNGWTRSAASRRDAVALQLGTAGRLDARRRNYLAERKIWSWWQAEHEWMRTPRTERTHRQLPKQNLLWQAPGDHSYPKHPRRADGRADYAAARAAHALGALEPVTLAA